MTSNIINLIVLTPTEGKLLTNGEIYSTQVYLGINDDINNWYEIDMSEAPEDWENPQPPEEDISLE